MKCFDQYATMVGVPEESELSDSHLQARVNLVAGQKRRVKGQEGG